MTPRDRYPGARPFADDPIDQRLYFGRTRETQEVFHRVLAEPLLVLYGKSGLGKTSLLQAGVFPRLRERDLLPIPVRLNRPGLAPLAVVAEALERTCLDQGIDYTPPAAPDLWTLLKTAAPWRGEALQTPVLVLDQFEEVFTLHDPAGRRAWAAALSELIGGRPPASVRERLRAGERLPFGEGPPAVRVVLSLREDHLGGLDEFAADLPAVLDNRLRLTAPERDAARDAIVEPAGLPRGEDLASPPLYFSEAALAALLDFLEGKSGIIEPFQLQVLCRHLERQGAARAPDAPEVQVAVADLGGPRGMAAVLAGFYREALAALPGRRERRRVRELCEWGLLSQDGRRLPMDEAEIGRQFRIAPATLHRLVDARLLRSEPRLEGVFYELSHDTLAESARNHRRRRLPRGLKIGVGVLVVLLAAALVGVLVSNEERRRADLARNEAEGLIEYMLFDLRDRLTPIGRLDLLQGINERVDAYYRTLGVEAGDLAMQRRRSAALINRGDTLAAQGDLAGALAAYRGGKAIFERLAAADPSNTDWQRDLSVSLNKVGDIRAAQGDLAGALAAYQEGKTIRERLAAADPSNTGWQRDLSVSLNKVGDIRAAQGDLAGALAAYQEDLAICERLAAADPSNTDWQRDLSVSLYKVGDIQTAQGDLAGALAVYQEGKTIRERLTAADPGNTDWQRDLSVSLERIGDIRAAQGDLAGALAAYQEGKAIRERLTAADQSNTDWQRDLSVSLNKIGDIRAAQGDLVGALAAYQEGKTIRERLAAADPSNTGWQRDLSVSLNKVGDIRAAQGDLAGALAAYQEDLAICERLAAADPSNVEWQTDLAVSLSKLSQPRMAEPGAAVGYLRRALEVLERLQSAGQLNAQQKDWPGQFRQRLRELETPAPAPKPQGDRVKPGRSG